LYCFIKKPKKDECCLARAPCSFRRITRALPTHSRPRNGNVNRLVMNVTERDSEVGGVIPEAKMVLLDPFP